MFSQRLVCRSGWSRLHTGVEHGHLRAARLLVPGAGRVDVVVVLVLDRALLADAGVVGALEEGYRAVVLDAQHALAGAQPGPQILERDAGARLHRRERGSRAAQQHAAAPARPTSSSLRASSVWGRNWTSSRVTAGPCPPVGQPVLQEVELGGRRRGDPRHQDRDESGHARERQPAGPLREVFRHDDLLSDPPDHRRVASGRTRGFGWGMLLPLGGAFCPGAASYPRGGPQPCAHPSAGRACTLARDPAWG